MKGVNREPPGPQERYDILLQRYVDLGKGIANLQSLHRPLDKIREIDRRKHIVHGQLNELGESLNKTPHDVYYDVLFTEGNLKDLGVSAPFLRIPLKGKFFELDDNAQATIPKDQFGIPVYYSLSLPGGDKGDKLAAGELSDSNSEASDNMGDKEFQKWNNAPYGLIVFSNYQWDHGLTYAPVLHITRMQRRKNLATDLELKLLDVDDNRGHNNYTPYSLHGIEVPLSRLTEITSAMRGLPEKYWLTQDEITNPYRLDYLVKEDRQILKSHMALCLKSVRDGDEESWIAFLRLYDGVRSIGPYENERLPRDFWETSLQDYLRGRRDMPNGFRVFSDYTARLKDEHPAKYSKISGLIEKYQ